jgi:hypothetical protein
MNAFQIHQSRVEFLNSLACLINCPTGIGATLADGTRPDVVRINKFRNSLFIGEAKNTELPTCAATQSRLRNYFKWLAVFQKQRRGNGIFAICFGDTNQTNAWVQTINNLAAEECLSWADSGTLNFEAGFSVVWFVTRNVPKFFFN